jgi:NADH-quinone oxidoreductase subunit G
MFALKSLMAAIGSPNLDCREPLSPIDPSKGRAGYIFNTTIDGIENSDALLLVGANPRFEASVLNARIRKRSRASEYPIGVIGEKVDLRYSSGWLGEGPAALAAVVDGSSRFAKVLKKAERPMIIVGQGAINRVDGAAILSMAAQAAMKFGVVKDGWNGFNVLHTAAARVGGLDIGFVPGNGGKSTAQMLSGMDVLFLLGADEFDHAATKGFVVYVGTHGDRGAHRADVILPASAYTEKSGLYVNTEGRVQLANRAVFAPGEAKEDWAIFRALSGVLGTVLPFDSLGQLRDRLIAQYPLFGQRDEVTPADAGMIAGLAQIGGTPGTTPFLSPITDFYLTNPIARASKVMANCSALYSGAMAQAAE